MSFLSSMPPQEKVILSEDKTISEIINSQSLPVRAIINGATCVVYSSLKKDELRWVKATYPDLLRVIGENGRPAFEVTLDDEMPGSVEEDVVTFGAPVSAEGYATITVLIDPEAEDAGSLIMDKMKEPLQHLAEIEESVFMMMRRPDYKKQPAGSC